MSPTVSGDLRQEARPPWGLALLLDKLRMAMFAAFGAVLKQSQILSYYTGVTW